MVPFDVQKYPKTFYLPSYSGTSSFPTPMIIKNRKNRALIVWLKIVPFEVQKYAKGVDPLPLLGYTHMRPLRMERIKKNDLSSRPEISLLIIGLFGVKMMRKIY